MAEQLRGPFEEFVDSSYYSVYVFEKWVERCKKYIACQGEVLRKRDPHGTSTKFQLVNGSCLGSKTFKRQQLIGITRILN
jgi:hypothetical protein